jgi:uncharacterized protein/tRNA (cytidine56-2'-O)-methyltransferase
LSTYPSEGECIRLLEEAGCKRRVIVHCCTVWTMAQAIASKIDCDMGLVRAGALLHDIGRSIDHSINHAVIGASIAADLNLPREVVEIVRRHVGAGLDEEEVREFNLPKGDYIPRTIEQKIVCHADNMVSDNKFVDHMYSVERLRAKGSNRGAKRIADLHKELSALYGEDLDILVRSLGPYPEMKGACAPFTVPQEYRS